MSTTQKYLIIRDRVEVYKDFTLNLLFYIVKYYLDKETLKEDDDIKGHFNWCFNKVCDEFKLEGIDFSTNEVLRDYFFMYYYHQLYKSEGKEIQPFEYYEKFWKNIFEFDKQRNKSIINVLIEVYHIFDKSINHEKNILELV